MCFSHLNVMTTGMVPLRVDKSPRAVTLAAMAKSKLKKFFRRAVSFVFTLLLLSLATGYYVKERVEAYRAAGVTHLQVTPVGPDPVELIEKLKSWAA